MLCYAMLCYAMLCYAMLCYAMLGYARLCYAISCFVCIHQIFVRQSRPMSPIKDRLIGLWHVLTALWPSCVLIISKGNHLTQPGHVTWWQIIWKTRQRQSGDRSSPTAALSLYFLVNCSTCPNEWYVDSSCIVFDNIVQEH